MFLKIVRFDGFSVLLTIALKVRNLLQFVAYFSGPLYDSDRDPTYETEADDSTPTLDSRGSDIDEPESGER